MDRLPKPDCDCKLIPLVPPDKVTIIFLSGAEWTYAVVGKQWVAMEVKENGVVRKLIEEN